MLIEEISEFRSVLQESLQAHCCFHLKMKCLYLTEKREGAYLDIWAYLQFHMQPLCVAAGLPLRLVL